jgi:hypothetical protein
MFDTLIERRQNVFIADEITDRARKPVDTAGGRPCNADASRSVTEPPQGSPVRTFFASAGAVGAYWGNMTINAPRWTWSTYREDGTPWDCGADATAVLIGHLVARPLRRTCAELDGAPPLATPQKIFAGGDTEDGCPPALSWGRGGRCASAQGPALWARQFSLAACGL